MRGIRSWCALLVVLLLIGCAPAKPTQADQVRDAVRHYDQVLAEGYRALDMSTMRTVASELQAEDEYIHMSSLAEGGIRLDPTLKKLEFVRVSVESTTAQVETRETWDYLQTSRATGKVVLEQRGLVYLLAWDLSRQAAGNWLVTDVRAISATTTVPPSILGTITPTPPRN